MTFKESIIIGGLQYNTTQCIITTEWSLNTHRFFWNEVKSFHCFDFCSKTRKTRTHWCLFTVFKRQATQIVQYVVLWVIKCFWITHRIFKLKLIDLTFYWNHNLHVRRLYDPDGITKLVSFSSYNVCIW